jgi:hypothetical protein
MWTSVEGRSYTIESLPSLDQPGWQELGTVQAKGPGSSFTDTTAGAAPQRYYRVKLVP